jgi:hypothetical protein
LLVSDGCDLILSSFVKDNIAIGAIDLLRGDSIAFVDVPVGNHPRALTGKLEWHAVLEIRDTHETPLAIHQTKAAARSLATY